MTSFAALIAPPTAPMTTSPALGAHGGVTVEGDDAGTLFSAVLTEVTKGDVPVSASLAPDQPAPVQADGVTPDTSVVPAAFAFQAAAPTAQKTQTAPASSASIPSSEDAAKQEPAPEINSAISDHPAPIQSPPQPRSGKQSDSPVPASSTPATSPDPLPAPLAADTQTTVAAEPQDTASDSQSLPTGKTHPTIPLHTAQATSVVPAQPGSDQEEAISTAESAANAQIDAEAEAAELPATAQAKTAAQSPQMTVMAASSLPLRSLTGQAASQEIQAQDLQTQDGQPEEKALTANQLRTSEASASPTDAAQKPSARADANAGLATSLQAQLETAKTSASGGSSPMVADPTIESDLQAATHQANQSNMAPDLVSGPNSGLSRATIETTALISAQILKKLDGRSTRFDMTLTPESLGRVDVSLEIDSDGQVTARLAFDNPAAAADLRGRVDELRRQLQEAGLQLHKDSFEFTDRNPSSGFGGGAFDRQPRHRAFAGAARLQDQADSLTTATPPLWSNLNLTPDRVDLKV